MPKTRKSLKHLRKLAHISQDGKCYYCSRPIWEENCEQFAKEHNLSHKQAKLLRSTGEHLVAHCDDGIASKSNIVAACSYCNIRRHKRKNALSPKRYKKLVERRIAKGTWHQINLNIL